MKKKPSKKHDPRSEAAQREAIRKRGGLIWCGDLNFTTEIRAYASSDPDPLAIFDLRDCYRKRAPLKGITNAMRKAVQPKRKVKRTKRTK